MKIAVFGITIQKEFSDETSRLFDLFRSKGIEVYLYEPFAQFIKDECLFLPEVKDTFSTGEDLPKDVQFLFSIGGDGTFLNSFRFIKNTSIPVVGINLGRLGFLSDISIDQIEEAIDNIQKGEYIIDERSVLEVCCNNAAFGNFNYALNEITVTKQDSSSMIKIHAYLNGEFLNTYWADGLIVATPTGSTAYSLSVGGPILTPDSESFIISPIAPHTLTVRPIVVPNSNTITLKVEGRGQQFLASVDSRSESFDFPNELTIRKADFGVKTLRMKNHNFYTTLRSKLMWGLDKRN